MNATTQKADDRFAPLADHIDFGHLSRYTMGEPALTEELLGSFCGQVDDFLVQIDEGDAQARARALHTLKGAARAIGAFPLAEAVATAERELAADGEFHRAALMEHVEAMRGACRRWRDAMMVA